MCKKEMSAEPGVANGRRRRRPAEIVSNINDNTILTKLPDGDNDSDNEKNRSSKKRSVSAGGARILWSPVQKHGLQGSNRGFGWTSLHVDSLATRTVLVLLGMIMLWLLGRAASSTSCLLSSRRSRRPATDEALNSIPLVIPVFDFENNPNDIGGWMHIHKFHQPKTKIWNIGQVDRGGITGVGVFGEPRLQRPDDQEDHARNLDKYHRDHKKMHSYNEFNEDVQDRNHTCQRANWTFDYFPSCNNVHTLDLSHNYDKEAATRIGYPHTLDSFYIT